VIDEYLRAIRSFAGVEFLAIPSFGTWDVIKALPQLLGMLKWFKISMAEFAQRFSHPFLRQAFPWAQYDFANIPMAVHLAFMAGCAEHTLGWPVGGSLEFSRAIERRYLSLGGEMRYRARVTQILVENDRAVGVRLADGSEARADLVISAADGRSTILEMLGGRYADDAIRAYYAAAPARQEMSVQVSYGVARDLTREAHALTLFLPAPVTLCGETVERLDVENYAFEPSFAPAGKTVLKVMLTSTYDYWAKLRERRAGTHAERRMDYDAEKQRLAEAVLALLERRFPGITAQVEMTDVATPLTTERYTANYHGLQAWGRPNAKALDALKPFTTTLPGLRGFYMVGQWAGATIGLSTAAIAGRKLAQRLCKEDGKRFVAMRP
jgi:phytoene dehydrogenase-like protein